MIEKACFYHYAENCNFKAWIIVSTENNIVMTCIWDNFDQNPKIKIRKYKSIKKAYKNYLFTLGKVLRGYWKFDKFKYN